MILLSQLLFILTASGNTQDPDVSVVTDPEPGITALYGMEKLTGKMESAGISYEVISNIRSSRGKYILKAGLSSGSGDDYELESSGDNPVPGVGEAYTIRKEIISNRNAVIITGSDDTGLMYGLQEISALLSSVCDGTFPISEVVEVSEKPFVRERALSIYTFNRAYLESRLYNEEYWIRYLDMMAENRFNSLVFIFGYENGGFLAPPYPYFFDLEGYPDIFMVGVTPADQERNLSALNNIIRLAHERGIKFTVGIWDHIYRGGVQGGTIPGKDIPPDRPEAHMVWGVTSDNLNDYTMAALGKFIKEVPGLDAIQLRMHWESGLRPDEQPVFFRRFFGLIKEEAPHIRLDLRAKQLANSVIQEAIDAGVDYRITTKYWMEQVGMPFHPSAIPPERQSRRHSYADLLEYPKKYNIMWRLWTGATGRVLLWGDPDYTQRFVYSTRLYDGDGFEVNEPLCAKMLGQPHDAVPFNLLNPGYTYYDWEFERYWHFLQLFGRIGYNPDVSPALWGNEFESRFGTEAGPVIASALHRSSWILPRIVATCYPYDEFALTYGWAGKERLHDLPRYARATGGDPMQFATFDEEAELLIEKGTTAKMLPSRNAMWFAETAEELFDLTEEAASLVDDVNDPEYMVTIADIKILAGLALYHSRRIPAAVNYRLFKRTGDPAALERAITGERSAIEAWAGIVAAAGDIYTDDLMMGTANQGLSGHWKDELAALEKGLEKLERERDNLVNDPGFTPAPVYQIMTGEKYEDRGRMFIVSHSPVSGLKKGEQLQINIDVTSPAGVSEVRLKIRALNQEMEYGTIVMEKEADSDSYHATLSASNIDPAFDLIYFFELFDSDGNGMIWPDFEKVTPYYIISIERESN